MKKISVVIPCYFDEKSVREMHARLTAIFQDKLAQYDYEIIFVDDCSGDATRQEIETVCALDQHAKGVFNAKNFGFSRNVFASLRYASGDGVFMLFGDLQDPPEMLPQFVGRWEAGKKVIVGQKEQSDENKIMFFFRSLYYQVIGHLSPVPQIQHFNGYGFYDKVFIDVLRLIDDPQPYLKGIVGEFGMQLDILKYHQAKSARGKSNFNFFKYYDVAMQGITSYTKIMMRAATFVGAILGILCILIALGVLILKLMYWDAYPAGIPSLIVGLFFIGAVQLFFLGIMGEYILSINTRSMRRPLVVVEKRIHFDDEMEQDAHE